MCGYFCSESFCKQTYYRIVSNALTLNILFRDLTLNKRDKSNALHLQVKTIRDVQRRGLFEQILFDLYSHD